MAKYMLSTIDNPYNPFDDFDNWYMFDMQQGYSSCSYLARIARTSEQFSEAENNREVERAIDEIIKYDFRNLYIKVKDPAENPDSESV